MKQIWKWSFLALGLLPSLSRAGVSIDKLTGEVYSDIGQLVEGNAGGPPILPRTTVEGQYLSRLGVTLTAIDTVQNRLEIKIGVGGIFWQAFPPGDFWQNSLKFGPGITEASANFLATPAFNLEGGYFPFKYNPGAMDLGEYLLRSESYPTYIVTGGWTWVDSAFTRTLGFRARASHFGGAFQHEAGLYFEYQNPPLYDITPAYLFSWRPFKGVEIGGGAALKRWFHPNIGYSGISKIDSNALPASQYVEIANFPEVQNQATVKYTYLDGDGATVSETGFAVWRPDSAMTTSPLLYGKNGLQVQSVTMIQNGSAAGTRKGIKKFLMNMRHSDGTNCWDGSSTTCQSYYDAQGNVLMTDADGEPLTMQAPQIVKEQTITRRAVNLMGRVNFDIAKIFNLNGTGPFKLYAELAVLGVENQPVYYQDITRRMPVMAGLHVPTFGALDLLAVEMEYLNNPYLDSQQELGGQDTEPLVGPSMAIPDLDYSKPMFALPTVHGDDTKWSVHAVRTIVPGLKMKVQVANDHIRLQHFSDGISTSPTPQTVRKSQWYYIAHLQWGI